MVCKICGVEKPAEDFYLFKNADGVPRRRHNCKQCIIQRELTRYHVRKGKVVEQHIKPTITRRGRPEIIINDYEGERTCRKCGIEKPLTEFYFYKGRHLHSCKECERQKHRLSAEESLDYRTQPGEWISEEQKELVHNILNKIGWSFNSIFNIWYKIPKNKKKDIYKDKFGTWHNLKKQKKVKTPKKTGRKKLILPMHKIIKLYQMGWSYKQLGEQFGACATTIRDKIYEHYRNA